MSDSEKHAVTDSMSSSDMEHVADPYAGLSPEERAAAVSLQSQDLRTGVF